MNDYKKMTQVVNWVSEMMDFGEKETWDCNGNVISREWTRYDPMTDRVYRAPDRNGPYTMVDPKGPGSGRCASEYLQGRIKSGKTTLVKTRFQIDLGPEFEGYHYPEQSWNGWECPWFTLEVAMEIARENSQYPESYRVEFDPEKDMFIVHDSNNDYPEERETFEGQDIEGMHLYPIGNMSWIWDEVEEHQDEIEEDDE